MKNILVATDLSEASYRAIERARRIAVGRDAALRIVYVAPRALDAEAAVLIEDELTDRVTERSAMSGETVGHLSIRVRSGPAAAAILEEAKIDSADLIVLGNHGEARLRDAIFGTTASHVAQHSPVPVLVAQTDPEQRYRRVMTAVDDDMLETVLDGAAALVSAEELYVVHAHVPTLQSVFAGGDPMDELRQDHEANVRAVVDRVSRSRLEGDSSPRVHCITEDDEPVDVIMKEWDAIRPDLLVVGTHGRSGIAKLLRASVAETVLLGCPSDVLVIPGRSAG